MLVRAKNGKIIEFNTNKYKNPYTNKNPYTQKKAVVSGTNFVEGQVTIQSSNGLVTIKSCIVAPCSTAEHKLEIAVVIE